MTPRTTSAFYPFGLALAGVLSLRLIAGLGSGYALGRAEARIREVGLSRRLGPGTLTGGGPADEDALAVCRAALEVARDEGEDLADPLSDQDDATLARYVERYRKATQLVDLAAPGGFVPTPRARVTGREAPNFLRTRRLMTALAARVELAFRAGRTGDVPRLVEAGLRLSNVLAYDALLITNMIRVACLRDLLEPLRKPGRVAALAPESATALRRVLADIDLPLELRAALQGEVRYFRSLLPGSRPLPGYEPPQLWEVQLAPLRRSLYWLGRPLLELSVARYLGLMAGVYGWLDRAAEADADPAGYPEASGYWLVDEFVPNVRAAHQRISADQGKLDELRGALAARAGG